jgi:hypothetical protein
VIIPVVLWGCMMLGPYDFVRDRRYYLPAVPLALLVTFFGASLHGPRTLVLRSVASAYLACYVAFTLSCIFFFFVPTERGTSQRAKLLSSDASEVRLWPSMRVGHELSPARAFVKGLLEKERETILVMSRGAWFYWDPTVDQSRIHELDCTRWNATRVTGPARVVVLTFNLGEAEQLWYYDGNFLTYSGTYRANCAEQLLPGLKLLKQFPDEGVKVLEARIPAGEQIVLQPHDPARAKTARDGLGHSSAQASGF